MCVCVFACVFVHVCGLNVCVTSLYGNVVSGFKLFTDLFTRQRYVQRGENDICDDGKEIAEAEDWESIVKENRVRT